MEEAKALNQNNVNQGGNEKSNPQRNVNLMEPKDVKNNNCVTEIIPNLISKIAGIINSSNKYKKGNNCQQDSKYL